MKTPSGAEKDIPDVLALRRRCQALQRQRRRLFWQVGVAAILTVCLRYLPQQEVLLRYDQMLSLLIAGFVVVAGLAALMLTLEQRKLEKRIVMIESK